MPATDRGGQPADEGQPDAGPMEEALTMRRLAQADALVRAGLAHARGQVIRLSVEEADEGAWVEVPLPPQPLRPSFHVSLPEAFESPAEAGGFFRTLTDRLSAVLPGALQLSTEGDSATITWTPRHLDATIDVLGRARAMGEHLTRLANAIREGAPAPSELERATERIERRQRCGEQLASAFDGHALLRLPTLGVVHVLAHRPHPEPDRDPLLLVLQVDGDLLSERAGRGFYLALRLPGWTAGRRPERLAELLVQLTQKRLGLTLQVVEDFEVLGTWHDVSGTALLTVQETVDQAFETLLWPLRDLTRFTESLVDLSRRGHSPFDLLGASDPGPETEPPPELAAAPSEPESRPAPPKAVAEADSAPEPRPAARPAAPTPPRPRRPERRRPTARPTAPPAEGIDSLSAREVVKRLGLQETADVDVFMSHPGYNPTKTIDILSVALSMTREAAKQIVETAPCLVVGPVTRARAVQLKTILEGTGATIRVIPTGESGEV